MLAAERDARAVLDTYLGAFNSRDIHTMMTFFTEESVVVNWSAGRGESSGLEDIRGAYEEDFRITQGDQALTISNVEFNEGTLTCEMKFRTRDVGTLCDPEMMTVQDGTIVKLEVPAVGSVACD